ncbi:MAG: hypothetical protein ACBR12_14285 [Microcoleus sp.]
MGGIGSGGSRGGGRKAKHEDEKSIKATFQINNGAWKYFCALVNEPAERHRLIQNWIRIYSIAGGESDRLLAQSPLAVELLNYLEVADVPEELRDKLESLIVARDSDEVKIAEGVARIGDSYVV